MRGRIGQPSVPLALNPDGAFAIGIKIGRRSADWLLVDFAGQVRQRQSLDYAFPDAATLLPEIARRMNTLHDTLGAHKDRLVGIGVAAPFQLGGWHRMLGLSQAQSAHWNALDLRAEVQTMTDAPVSFAKDTSAACVAELVAGRGRDLKNFLYLFVDTFVGGGLVINSHLHGGVHGNAGAVASLPLALACASGAPNQTASVASCQSNANPTEFPAQLISQASLWQLEHSLAEQQLDPLAAYDERALAEPFAPHTQAWVSQAANALAHAVLSGTALLDIDAVVVDGSFSRALLAQLIAATQTALQRYNWEGLWRANVIAGNVGPEARALGGALMPLHANFAPDQDLFLKSGA